METTADIAPILRLSRLFEHITEEELTYVANLCALRHYHKHDHLFIRMSS